ncbi:MAG: HmuY family protein [Ginsengibacter sp.]|jgi:hypothetical protein
MKTLKLSLLASALLIFGISSCKKDTPATPPTPAVYSTADLSVPFNPSSSFVFFSFKNGAVVASTDSATTKWDIGVRYVDIILNSHSSGPGNAGVITQMVNISTNTTFDSLKEAPTTGYAYDTTSTSRAINTDLNAGWYNYDRNTHAFSSKADRFFIIRTADNHYVKMEILSVGYAPFTGPTPVTLDYKIRYAYQPNNATNF